MKERYIKNIGPLTAEENEQLRSKKVCIAGCGGLGGYAAELLARLGVGTLSVVDADVFDKTNLNRQILCREADIGRSKAQTAKRRIAEINSANDVQAFEVYITEENVDKIISGCDAVIDCLDSADDRKLLYSACSRQGIHLVHAAIGGWCIQASVIPPGSDMLDIIYQNNSTAPADTLSFVPAFAASVQICEAVKLLTGRPVTLMNKLLVADLLSGTEEIIDFN